MCPADHAVRRFLVSQGRGGDWRERSADADAAYDAHEAIDLSTLEPLVACPRSPDHVVPVRQVAGRAIYQASIGSSANPGLRDFAGAAFMVDGRQGHEAVPCDVQPTSRHLLEHLTQTGLLAKLMRAGGRLHQAGCNGGIGMGQAPAPGRLSVRTGPRSSPGRSGTPEDRVYLGSPETAAASALTGVLTDPRTLHRPYPRVEEPDRLLINTDRLVPPAPAGERVELVKGPNIPALPPLEPLPDSPEGPVWLKRGDNISTDEIMPAGGPVLPYRSNIPAISTCVFRGVDASYDERALRHQQSGSFLVGGRNDGQGSSREHAAVGPRALGVKAVIAKSFARMHRPNLINFGIPPLTLAHPDDGQKIAPDHVLRVPDARQAIQRGTQIPILNQRTGDTHLAEHGMTDRQVQMLLAGSLIDLLRARHAGHGA